MMAWLHIRDIIALQVTIVLVEASLLFKRNALKGLIQIVMKFLMQANALSAQLVLNAQRHQLLLLELQHA